MGNSIFKFISSILIIMLSQLIYVSKGISDTYYSDNLSSACNFVFSNYFKKFVKIENNNATFFINKNDPSVLFTTTNELDVSLQITVKKINNPKSPTITLFMALEKGKDFGNFIIPNLRQNFCNGKFKPINSSKNNLIANNSQSSASNLQDKIELNQKSKKENIVENINIAPLKTKIFKMGKFDYDKLEKIKISNDFPKYRISAVESCKSNKSTNNKWKSNIIFWGDENLIWAVKSYWDGKGVRIYMGTNNKNDKIIFKVVEAHKRWDNMLDWINGYTLNLKNKSFEDALNQTLRGNYASSGSYRRKCEIKFDRLIKTKDTLDHLKNIEFLERRQKESLRLMDKFGIRFAQKYDFEAVKLVVKDLNEKEKKLAEEKAKRDAERKVKKLAEEKAKREAEEKAKKLAEEKAKKLAVEKAKREAEEKTKKLAVEKAKREAQEKAKKLAVEKAKREAEEKTKKLAEEKAKREAQEKAKKLAEEKAKREAQEKAKKLAEEKAKREAEEKAKREIRVSKISEKYYQAMVSMKDIFNIGEAYIKNHSKINELNEIKVKLDEYLKKPIEEYEFLKKEKYTKLHSEYISLLFKFYNEELKSGKIPNQNDFMNALKRYISNQKKYLNNYKVKFQNKLIIEDFMNEFSVNDWPNDIEKMLNKIEKLNILNKNMILAAKSNDVWNNFIYPSNIHIKKLKLFELEMENWINQSSEKFKSYYNKRLYDLSVQKNLNQIKEKQDKDEDFFNKIGN